MRNLHAGEGGEVYRVLSTGVLVYWNFLSENVIEHCPYAYMLPVSILRVKLPLLGLEKGYGKGFFKLVSNYIL